jgi:hypothetical protein
MESYSAACNNCVICPGKVTLPLTSLANWLMKEEGNTRTQTECFKSHFSLQLQHKPRTGPSSPSFASATSLVLLAHESNRYVKMIIEEGGVGPLLKLMKEEGNTQDRDNAARAIPILKPINSAIILITNAAIMRTEEELSIVKTFF